MYMIPRISTDIKVRVYEKHTGLFFSLPRSSEVTNRRILCGTKHWPFSSTSTSTSKIQAFCAFCEFGMYWSWGGTFIARCTDNFFLYFCNGVQGKPVCNQRTDYIPVSSDALTRASCVQQNKGVYRSLGVKRSIVSIPNAAFVLHLAVNSPPLLA